MKTRTSSLILAALEVTRANPGWKGVKVWVVGQEKKAVSAAHLTLSVAWPSAQKGRGERRQCFQKGMEGQRKKMEG